MAKTYEVHMVSLRRLLATVILVALKVSGIMESSYCAKPGDQLIFECTVIGRSATVWHGSAFDCGGGNDEIGLRHSQYSSEQGASGTCNNGDILVQTIGVDNSNHYISQVNVNVTSEMHNKTIECDREDFYRVTISVFKIFLAPQGT